MLGAGNYHSGAPLAGSRRFAITAHSTAGLWAPLKTSTGHRGHLPRRLSDRQPPYLRPARLPAVDDLIYGAAPVPGSHHGRRSPALTGVLIVFPGGASGHCQVSLYRHEGW